MPDIIPIDDPDDPRLEPYREIRERDLKGRGGRFVVEGEVVLRAALTLGRFGLESILVGENRVGPAGALLALAAPRMPVYAASRAVLDRVAGFPMHRGILAMGLRGPPLDPGAVIDGLGPRARVVVLSGIANHDNVGGIFRNAAAFGADAVLCDAACCDPLYRKAIRVSAGAALIVPFAVGGSIETIVDALSGRGFEVLATSPRGREALADLVPPERLAVVFGTEGPGLPQALLDRMRSIRIAMAGGFDSLNVATTSGIVLHHLCRGDRAGGR